jgi:transcription elongation factor Elf1
MSLLQKADGPPCPRCGCQDVRIMVLPPAVADPTAALRVAKYGVSQWFAAGRAKCRHCALTFSFRELPRPAELLDAPPPPAAAESQVPAPAPAEAEFHPYPVEACPRCGSARVKVTSTRKPVRHHACADCRASGRPATFKSREL